jgi:predicted phage terminase large subunit-like protein
MRNRLLQTLLRHDFASFVEKTFTTLEPGTPFRGNWHHHAIAYHLEQVARGEIRRLIINVPPRSMKSICCSIAFPAWYIGRDPTRRIICVSYAHELARKLAVDFRTVVESPWYRALFPELGIELRRQRTTEIVTTAQGYRLAASVGGSVMGRGADLIIIDDPLKPEDAWSEALRRKANEFYDNTLFTRLNDKTRGAIILVMQRLHEDDLVGHVLAREDWTVLSIPAVQDVDRDYPIGPAPGDVYHRPAGELLHPEREPQKILDELRRTLGSLSFSAQYLQSPLPIEGNIIKRLWLRFYEEVPEPLDLVVASWDTASTENEESDYSVGTIWGLRAGDIYLLDVRRGKYEVPELRRQIIAAHHEHRASATLIEDSDIGRAVSQELRREGRIRPICPKPRYDKLARLLAQSPRFEEGRVLLPREAPWLADYIGELLGFPRARHDDQVDSTSQALEWLWRKVNEAMPPQRPNPTRPQGRPLPGRVPPSGVGAVGK